MKQLQRWARVVNIDPLGEDRGGPYFGGGGGLGAPVVSYAPRPMLFDSFSLAIIVVLVVVLSVFYVSSLFQADAEIGNTNVTGRLTNRLETSESCS